MSKVQRTAQLLVWENKVVVCRLERIIIKNNDSVLSFLLDKNCLFM